MSVNIVIGFIMLICSLICLPIGKRLKEKRKKAAKFGEILKPCPADWLYDFAVNGLFIGTILLLWGIFAP